MNELYTLSLNDMYAQAEDTIKKTQQDVDSLNELVGEQLSGLTAKDLKSDMLLCLFCSIICTVYSLFLCIKGYYTVAGLCCLVLSPVGGLYMYFVIRKSFNGYKTVFNAREYLNFTAQSLERQLSFMDDDLRQYSISDTAGYRFKINERKSVFAKLSSIETYLSQFKASGSPYSSSIGKNLVILSAAAISVSGFIAFLPLVCDVLEELVYAVSDTTLGEWGLYLSIAATVITIVLVYFLFKLIWSKSNCRVSGIFVMCIPFTVLIFPVVVLALTAIVALGLVLLVIGAFVGGLAIMSGLSGASGG